jgi:hypothetical protein
MVLAAVMGYMANRSLGYGGFQSPLRLIPSWLRTYASLPDEMGRRRN